MHRYAVRGNPKQLVAWLMRDRAHPETGKDIAALLHIAPQANAIDRRTRFSMCATFALQGSLLIRSGNGDVNAADVVHLRSYREHQDRPILSGTSLAGALRARALRIVNTIGRQGAWDTAELVFGRRDPDKKGQSHEPKSSLTASRLIVHETVIRNSVEPVLVQSRVKIDRFTSGAYATGLFSVQPEFAKPDTVIDIQLELRNAKAHEIGLLLLLLKDLWTGDLPLGGESSVGRGRLKGKCATLTFGKDEWIISGDDTLVIEGSEKQKLEDFVSAFTKEVQQ